jgi:hypothetical protein
MLKIVIIPIANFISLLEFIKHHKTKSKILTMWSNNHQKFLSYILRCYAVKIFVFEKCAHKYANWLLFLPYKTF